MDSGLRSFHDVTPHNRSAIYANLIITQHIPSTVAFRLDVVPHSSQHKLYKTHEVLECIFLNDFGNL